MYIFTEISICIDVKIRRGGDSSLRGMHLPHIKLLLSPHFYAVMFTKEILKASDIWFHSKHVSGVNYTILPLVVMNVYIIRIIAKSSYRKKTVSVQDFLLKEYLSSKF